ncbi:MAG: CCA tRNA nucleotidyltransferase [Candidatus Zixiibacteriota bacterium]|nr:MAG: CCA tRNA nucleotidyltransferase [candidate division Zixibacteria bacterium]
MCRISNDAVNAILKKGMIYEVGGAVRDKMLDQTIEVKDRDYLVCGIPYLELSGILKKFGHVDLVGRSFGVIKFTQHQGEEKYTFDVALPRKEFSTGVGHKDFSVAFEPNLKVEDDLTRRDFTINAMAISLENDELIDPFGGQLDLKNRVIRMVSAQSFPEDPLRMLRAVQFAARFEFDIEPDTFAAMTEHASLIGSVSSERITEELNKMLVRADRPSIGFRLMQSSGLLNHILPEIGDMIGVDQPGGYHKYDVFEHTLYTIDAAPKVLHVRLGALFHDVCKPRTRRVTGDKATFYGHEKLGAKTAAKVMRRLRYSSDMIHSVRILVDKHMFTTDVTDKGMRRLIRWVGKELIFDLLDLRRADVEAQGMGGTTEDVDQFENNIIDELERKPPISVKDLAVDGHDLMVTFELPESPLVGELLKYLLEKVLDEPGDNTREKLMEFARSYLANRKQEH